MKKIVIVFNCRKKKTQQYQQRDIWVWIFLLRLPSEKAVPLQQQYSNNWITWDNSSCEGCGEATSQDERALDHWTLGNLITSLLNAKGQKRQLCRILNATKNKNNVLLHWGKKKNETSYTWPMVLSPSPWNKKSLNRWLSFVKQKEAYCEN